MNLFPGWTEFYPETNLQLLTSSLSPLLEEDRCSVHPCPLMKSNAHTPFSLIRPSWLTLDTFQMDPELYEPVGSEQQGWFQGYYTWITTAEPFLLLLNIPTQGACYSHTALSYVSVLGLPEFSFSLTRKVPGDEKAFRHPILHASGSYCWARLANYFYSEWATRHAGGAESGTFSLFLPASVSSVG